MTHSRDLQFDYLARSVSGLNTAIEYHPEVTVSDRLLANVFRFGSPSFNQAFQGLAQELLSVPAGQLRFQRCQLGYSTGNDLTRGSFSSPVPSGGGFHRAEWECVYLGKAGVSSHLECGGEVVILLSREAQNDVGRDRGLFEGLPYPIRGVSETVHSVLTIHAAEDPLRAGLKRQMEVRRKS